MTLIAEIAAIVTGVASIVGGVIWLFKKNPAKVDQQIDQTVAEQKQTAEETGRPQ